MLQTNPVKSKVVYGAHGAPKVLHQRSNS
jgi:hypothetical protein